MPGTGDKGTTQDGECQEIGLMIPGNNVRRRRVDECTALVLIEHRLRHSSPPISTLNAHKYTHSYEQCRAYDHPSRGEPSNCRPHPEAPWRKGPSLQRQHSVAPTHTETTTTHREDGCLVSSLASSIRVKDGRESFTGVSSAAWLSVSLDTATSPTQGQHTISQLPHTKKRGADTDASHSIQTWALEEARRRLEAEGILQDPEKTD